MPKFLTNPKWDVGRFRTTKARCISVFGVLVGLLDNVQSWDSLKDSSVGVFQALLPTFILVTNTHFLVL